MRAGPRDGRDARGRGDPEARGGFVVAVVVFVLFAVGMVATISYQLVRLEAELARQQAEGAAALAGAVAGLERYAGAQYGVPADSVEYVIAGTPVTVTARKVAEVDDVTDLYHLRSEGRVEDVRWTDSPARRVAQQYALLHEDPLGLQAALLVSSDFVRVRNGGRVDGRDASNPSDCSGGGSSDAIGLANTGSYDTSGGGQVRGSPAWVALAGFEAVYDSAGVRWDVLSDAGFAIRDDGSPPDWGTVAADSFPVVRAAGDLAANSSWDGRGVLIVPGTLTLSGRFRWEGIILAGELGDLSQPGSRIQGIVVGGLNGAQGDVEIRQVDIRYHSCNAEAAASSIAYLELLPGTWTEGS